MAFLATVVWALLGATVGIVAVLLLSHWRPDQSLAKRRATGLCFAFAPTVAVLAYALRGDPTILLSMSPAEFLEPFAVQIALICLFAIPAVWWVSRGAPDQQPINDIFE